MSTKLLPTSYVREHMAEIIKELHAEKEICFITQHGKPVAVFLDMDCYEVMMDLLEDREDEKDSILGHRLAEARAAYKSSGGIPLKDYLSKRKKS